MNLIISLDVTKKGFPVSGSEERMGMHIIVDRTCMSELFFSGSGQVD